MLAVCCGSLCIALHKALEEPLARILGIFTLTVGSRPKAGAHLSRLSGAPIQYRKEAVRGNPQGAHSCYPSKERADIQFPIGQEKAVIRIPGLNF